MAAFGTRGDGKTWAAMGAMIVHAQQHHERGYPLPTRWAGVTDTHQAHRLKTVRSLQAPEWRGIWRFRDDYHVAECVLDGQVLVHLDLFGIEDAGAMDRLRMEMHGLWFEEPAPASVMVQSSGVNEGAWLMGLTSQRMASYHHPAIMTLNYPDEDHWTWKRFVAEPAQGTGYVRIPPGERASAVDREEWARALASRPDMLRRLLEGKPGTLMLGQQVAVGFTEELHAPAGLRLAPVPGVTVHVGQDGGLTPTSIVAQRIGSRLRVLASLYTEHGGIQQHVQYLLRPWLAEHAPWALQDRDALHVHYDPSMNKDSEANSEENALRIMQHRLMARYSAGQVEWDSRKNPMLSVLGGLVQGEPVVTIDPVQARGLVRALNGGWHYPTGLDGKVKGDQQPVKDHPHSDHGDAFCYLVAGVGMGRLERKPVKAYTARTDFNALDYHRPAWERGPYRARTGVSAWGDA